MPEQFLHGVEVIEIDSGPRPIRTVRSSVIGLIGTAPDADEDRFPANFPVLIAGKRSEAAGLGSTGTLPAAIDDIFDQTGAMIVVIRVEESEDEPFLEAEIGPPLPGVGQVIGGIDDETGQYLGIQAFLAAESEVHVTPRILIAPEFSHHPAVANELLSVAERLRAVVIADGPNYNDEEAIDYRQMFGSPRLYLIDPWVRVWDAEDNVEVVRPASARVAGLIAKSDAERGFWWSPSNREIRGLMGTARSVDFALGDVNARANFLNENEVATIIQKDGFRLWGNRSCSADPKWAFLSVRRTADMINESLLRAHMWAVDRNITKTYIEDVLEGVNAYLRHLQTVGAIINGRAWADPELNTPDQISQGKVYIDFDFTPPYPAEHITFRSHLVNDYLVEVLPDAA
ncbi:MAG: phage tail sheath subtilisin-like domain-containing protein [Candidatus Thiodiazotropha taylori]|uniref:Phage tail sheath subtilisin-like domain-containing protein n=1 Tax=Candidatus Thiodiazotropha taylori TaxID=2792791 RepID=A0A9E4KDT3_9GAMM|nr:phage tail sheath subtilisin-like domain-containing protein [Candidatus Thiodiazotropha taylori]MCW4257505.1 phage tail sheath subtilisin-like domain-containing protein [Candidatus Thiodiazotropha taylori]